MRIRFRTDCETESSVALRLAALKMATIAVEITIPRPDNK